MTTKKAIILLFVFTIISTSCLAQSYIRFNSSGGTPDPSAIMDIISNEKGILIPRMSSTDRLNITNPAEGLLLYQNDGTKGFFYYNGANWDTLGGSTVNNVSNVTNVSNSGIAVIRDLKNAGVDGGNFDNGAWRTRDLNDLDGDLSFISLANNKFTLDSGVYVIKVIAPANEVKTHQVRLYNSTKSSIEAVGTISYADKFSFSFITAVVNVDSGGETFSIEHRCSDSKNDGFGDAASWGENVFTQVEVSKL